MKKMKKAAAMLMAATVAVAMPMTAMAASIEVTDAVEGEVYRAYKIFDYTKNGDNYSYTISKDSEWKEVVENFRVDDRVFFTLTASKNDENVLVVTTPWDDTNKKYTEMTDAQAADFAEHLKKNMEGKASIPEEGEAAGADKKVDFGNLNPGYYFVNTTTGSVCSLFNSDSSQKLKEKNKLPEVEKEVINAEGVASSSTTASIGDIVTYKITVNDGKGTDKAIIVHDKMSNGLELVVDSEHPFTVKKNGSTVLEEGADYELKTGGNVSETSDATRCTFEVELKDTLVTKLSESDSVIITYSAKITKGILDSNDGVKNSANITYSNSKKDIPTPPTVYTYGFDLVKTDKDNKVLEGAEFKLYSDRAATNEIKVVEMTDDEGNKTGVYRVAEESETGDVIKAGVTTIEGLGNGEYYLVETAAPQGFNPLTVATKVDISDGDNKATFTDGTRSVYEKGGVQVINYTGTILPSTGGIGTTVFYAAGIVVMAGAVFFVVRSRKHE